MAGMVESILCLRADPVEVSALIAKDPRWAHAAKLGLKEMLIKHDLVDPKKISIQTTWKDVDGLQAFVSKRGDFELAELAESCQLVDRQVSVSAWRIKDAQDRFDKLLGETTTPPKKH